MDAGPARQKQWAYYAGFLILGLTTAALGPSLPYLARATGSTLESIGYTFPARAGAYLFASWLVGRLYDRFRGHLLMTFGLVLIGLTLVMIPYTGLLTGLIALLVIMGLGMGILDVGGNTLLLWSDTSRPGAAMNALHFFYGLGSFLSPLIIAGALAWQGGIKMGYLVFGVLTLPLILIIFHLPSPQPPAQSPQEGQTSFLLSEVKVPLLLVALFYFFYVGVEVGFGGWIHTYALQTELEIDTTAAVLTSVYWGAFTVSRLISIPLASRWKPTALLTADLCGALISLALILFWPSSRLALWLGTVGLGFSIASIFPTMLSFAHQQMRLQGKETAWLFVSAGLGAMSLPWIMSRFVSGDHPLRIMLVLLLDLILAVVLFGVLCFWPGWTATSMEENQA